MGVAGLLAWLQATFPECFVHLDSEVRNLFIDANSLVHDALRRSKSEAPQMVVVDLIEQIIAHHRPTESVIIALDGPAPFAKLDTQRSRRLKKALAAPGSSNSVSQKLSTSAVTPGTIFMSELDAELHRWADARLRAGRRPGVMIVDPSAAAGEVRGP